MFLAPQAKHGSLWAFCRHWLTPFKGQIVAGLLAMIVTNSLMSLYPLWLEGLLHQAYQQHQLVSTSVVSLVGVVVAIFASRFYSRMCLLGMGRTLESRLRQALFERLLGIPYLKQQQVSPDDMVSRLTQDLTAVRYFTAAGMMLGSNALFAYATKLPLMMQYSWQFTLVACGCYALCLWVSAGATQRLKVGFRTLQQASAKLAQQASESLTHLPMFQAYGQAHQEVIRFEHHAQQVATAQHSVMRERQFMMLASGSASAATLATLLTVGGWGLLQGHLPQQKLLSLMLWIEQLGWPTMSLAWMMSMFRQAEATLARIEPILTDLPTLAEQQSQQPNIVPALHFPLVLPAFKASYPAATVLEPAVAPPETLFQLSVPSLTVQGGQLIAVIGDIGSGKSTFLRTLAGLHPADVEDSASHEMLKNIAQQSRYLPQRPELFSASVAYNALWQTAPSPTDQQRLLAILDGLGFDADTLEQRFQQGVDTKVGERGMQVSGGQRQRLALSRALASPAQLLLLDDPFASIDPALESQLLETFKQWIQEGAFNAQRSVLFATQRLEMLDQCEAVWVVHQGDLLACGNVETLRQHPDEQVQRALGPFGPFGCAMRG